MNSEEQTIIANLENTIIEKGGAKSIDELANFPFSSYSEVVSLFKSNELSIGTQYDGEFMRIIGTKSERKIHNFWLYLPFIIGLIDIALAIIFKKWILILGVILAVIGFSSSSPYNPMRRISISISLLLFILSFFLWEWQWSVIIGSYLLSLMFSMTAREQYRMTLTSRAMKSETFFCHLFENKLISIKNTKTNKVFSY